MTEKFLPIHPMIFGNKVYFFQQLFVGIYSALATYIDRNPLEVIWSFSGVTTGEGEKNYFLYMFCILLQNL